MSTSGQFFRGITVGVLLLLGVYNQAFAQFAGGDGSSGNPYQIATATQLDSVRNHLSDHFILTADIDLDVAPYNTGTGWTPIGNTTDLFTGSLDGDGHTISNLYINRSTQSVQGLFGVVSGGNTIKDLTLTGVNITAKNRVGGLMGESQGCIVKNVHVSGTLNNPNNVSGLIIANTTVSSTLVDSSSSSGLIINPNLTSGGLIGVMNGNATVSNSYSSVSINSSGATGTRHGGLVGRVYSGSTVSNSYATGNVGQSMEISGGLVGGNEGVIQNSYSMGDVGSSASSGGLVGVNDGTIQDSYTTSAMASGGPLTNSNTGTITNSYWNSDSAGVADNGLGTGLTTIQMWDSTNFAFWDFTNTWAIVTGDSVSFPYLQSNIPDSIPGKQNVIFAGGDGTSGNPYQIATVTQLDSVRNYLDAHFILTADIDLDVAPYNTGTGWEPIGTTAAPFTGSLDGDGHTISNLYINSTQNYQGLFGVVSGGNAFKDLTMTGLDITAVSAVGGFIGKSKGAYIDNVHVSGSLSGYQNLGLLLGEVDNSSTTVDSSSSDGSIQSEGSQNGGLIGSLGNGNTLSNSHSSVTITYVGSSTISGGLVGLSGSGSTISNSFASGSVGAVFSVGGLVGYNSGTIQDSYATGDASSTSGILGGLTGENYGTLLRTYAMGSISGSGGPLSGVNSGTITNSYWNSDSAGVADNGFGTGLTTIQMWDSTNFNSWDFTNTWAILSGDSVSFPYLQSNIPDPIPGKQKGLFDGGDGTTGDPYQIATAAQLYSMHSYLDAHFILTADIDLGVAPYNTSTGWEPIGTTAAPFTGSLDGNGHTISNLFIDNSSQDSLGLFGVVSGGNEFKDLTLDNVDVTGNNYVSGFIGQAGDVSIDNVDVSGSLSGVNTVGLLLGETGSGTTVSVTSSVGSGTVVGAGQYAGGLFGKLQGTSTIRNCASTVNVTSLFGIGGLAGFVNAGSIDISSATGYIQGWSQIGGLVGSTQNAHIDSSYATGSITISDAPADGVGGLVGFATNSSAKITNSWASGDITATNVSMVNNVGGLAGRARFVENSYATGSISITGNGDDHNFIGGLIGFALSDSIKTSYATGDVTVTGASISNVGGLVGHNNNTTVYQSYATGTVTTSGTDIGGLVGLNSGGTITNSYWNSDSAGVADNSLGSGLTTIQMWDSINYSGWDFTNTWTIVTGDSVSFPYLRINIPDAIPGKQVKLFEGGFGTIGDPYQIATAKQLNNIRDYLGYYFTLTADIDLNVSPYNTGTGWQPIGSSAEPFSGSFDGQGFSIDGLMINRSITYVGLFGYTRGATITDMSLTNADVKGHSLVGALVGQMDSASVITNSSVDGVIESTGLYTGGLVGYMDSSSVATSHASDSVFSSGNFVGGLVGYSNYSTTEQSYATNAVSGASGVGGLIGQNDSTSTVDRGYATGIVSATDKAGGLVGINTTGSAITNSYSVGQVSGDSYIGGLVGRNEHSASVINSYSSTAVFGSILKGGLVGSNVNSTITASYWDSLSTGETAGIGEDDNSQTAVALTIPDMMSATSFTGWDFNSDTVWAIVEGGTFPYLKTVGTQITTAAAFDGSGGWRTVGQSGNVTYGDLLSHIWTQGYLGSDGGTGAGSNVYFFDEPSYTWKTPTDSSNYFGTNSATPSDSLSGALIWFYPDDDNDGNADTFPKYLVASSDTRNMDSTFTVPLSYTSSFSSDSSGWNLVSNPYPYSLNWRDVVDAGDNQNTLPVAFIWDHSLNSNNGGYKINFGYPLPPGAPADFFFDGHIPVMQSFWVKANSAGASLTFKPSYQEAAKSPYKINAEGAEPVKAKTRTNEFISLKLEGDGFSDRILLFPASEDESQTDIPKLTTLAGRFVEMVITGKGEDSKWISRTFEPDAVNEFDLMVESTESGKLQISLESLQTDMEGIQVILKDHENGTETLLSADNKYEFEISRQLKRTAATGQLPKFKSGSEDHPRFTLLVRTGTAVSSELEEGIPTEFTLNQNYPNPFNPSSTIRFGLPDAAEVRLEVFNLLGQKVSTLISGDRMKAGWHTVRFDARNLASGMYVYRIVAGGFVQTKRMMLIK